MLGDLQARVEDQVFEFAEVMISASLQEGMTPFHKTAYGMHNLLNREDVLLCRASTMPGFVTAEG